MNCSLYLCTLPSSQSYTLLLFLIVHSTLSFFLVLYSSSSLSYEELSSHLVLHSPLLFRPTLSLHPLSYTLPALHDLHSFLILYVFFPPSSFLTSSPCSLSYKHFPFPSRPTLSFHSSSYTLPSLLVLHSPLRTRSLLSLFPVL